jgi:hypothetical protein
LQKLYLQQSLRQAAAEDVNISRKYGCSEERKPSRTDAFQQRMHKIRQEVDKKNGPI